MQETNEFQEKVRTICEQYAMLVKNNLFTQEHIQKVNYGIQERVLPLLNAQKPKVMVYGIYNSGKSTLINVICKKEVAQVADRPMTDRVTEYDEGRYILIDSPGVNAPIQHEEIADSHLVGCHMILFVISSKGMFEDLVNYQKMWDLIKRGLPFYIVLNERSEKLPPKEEKAARQQAIRKHQQEINDIKRKIIKNLIKISGIKDIGDKYDVISINAKRAWMGIVKENEQLYQKSDISILLDRINAVLEGRCALKQLLAPLSVLEEMINETESFLLTQSGGQDYANKREIMCKKIALFRESFLADIRMAVEKQFESLYNNYLGVGEVDREMIWEGVYKDIEACYTNLIYPLNSYVREAFSDLGLVTDDRCNISFLGEEIERQSKSGASECGLGREKNAGSGQKFQWPGDGNITYVERQSTGLLDIIFNLFKSKRKKEQEEYERLSREVDAYNMEVSQRLEEDIRRHQDARTSANAEIDRMASQLRLVLSNDIEEKFNRVVTSIDRAIQRRGNQNQEIDSMLAKCRDMKLAISDLRRRIG